MRIVETRKIKPTNGIGYKVFQRTKSGHLRNIYTKCGDFEINTWLKGKFHIYADKAGADDFFYAHIELSYKNLAIRKVEFKKANIMGIENWHRAYGCYIAPYMKILPLKMGG